MNATASIEHALALHRGGDLAGAEEVYGHILRDDPDDVSALQLMGVICTQRGSWRDGEQYLRRCLAIAPGYAAAHGNLGLVLARTGRVDEALVSLRRSVVLDPAQPGVWSNLGMVLTRAGRYADFRMYPISSAYARSRPCSSRRPRKSRDFTVPSGTPSTRAISA